MMPAASAEFAQRQAERRAPARNSVKTFKTGPGQRSDKLQLGHFSRIKVNEVNPGLPAAPARRDIGDGCD